VQTEVSRTVRLRQTGQSAGQSQRLETQSLRVRVDRYSIPRTVRAQGADRPPFTKSDGSEKKWFLDKLDLEGRTVRAFRVDRPRFTFAHAQKQQSFCPDQG